MFAGQRLAHPPMNSLKLPPGYIHTRSLLKKELTKSDGFDFAELLDAMKIDSMKGKEITWE